ncbi:AsmA-like C-terminal region-containing protein [Mesorhizobium sp. KR9-304]|uniref:AsmA family protein n=1 Tax=Mesorhizobium sp. KR9-304 TaxID=3156614 RepID=UPI0032B4B470
MPSPLLRRGLWALALAAGLIVLIVLALPYAASTRLVRDHIAHEMSEWSGLDVSIGAAPEISVWPDLQANLTDVTLSLPGGATPAITAERVEIELSALAALGGAADFTRTRFTRPIVRIEGGGAVPVLPRGGKIARAIDTAREIVAEDRAAPDTGRLPGDAFGVVEFTDGKIVSVSGGAETEIVTGLSGEIGWENLDGQANATATGVWRGEQFTLDLGSANPLLFLGGAATPVTASVKSGPVNLAFDGIAGLGENPYVDGRVSFSAPSARKMLEWSQAGILHGSALGAVAMESRVMGDAERMRFEEADITLDGEPARGSLDLLLAGKLPMLAGTLAFDRLDLRSFLSAFTPLDASAGEGPGIIDADFAGRLNLDLRLSAAQATIGPIALADFAATVRVDEGLAAFDISDASAFGGNVQAGLRFDRKAEESLVEMRLLASDVDGGAFATAAGMIRLAPIGRGTVSVILKGDGSSWNSLLSHANGSFSASFGQGALSGIDLEALVARSKTGTPFTLDAVAGDASPIDALDLTAHFADGVASIEKAELRTPLNRITLAGSAPLAGGSLDLSARVQPPQQATAGPADPGAATTFLIGGPRSAPVITPTTGLSAE